MKKLMFLSMFLLCSIIIDAQVTNNNKNVKPTTDPTKKVEFVKINNNEQPVDIVGRQDYFHKEGLVSTRFVITTLKINHAPILLVSDTIILEPNKYFEILTKNYGKFIIKINQSDNYEVNSIDLWILKNQEQKILGK
jgi:hypothetical protein